MHRAPEIPCHVAAQLVILTIIAATLLIRPIMKPDSLERGQLFVGMPFGLLVGLMMDNFSEMAITVESLPIFFRCSCSHSWALPSCLMHDGSKLLGTVFGLMQP